MWDRVEGRAKSRGQPGQASAQSWAGSWAVGMNVDPANRHSWTLKIRAA